MTGPASSGYLTAGATGRPAPTTSALNFVTGQTVANAAVVAVGPDGTFTVTNRSAGPVQIIVDLVGFTSTAVPPTGYRAVTPVRVLDTRTAAAIVPGGSRTLRVAAATDVPAASLLSATVNLTAAVGRASGYVVAGPTGGAPASTSSLNFSAGQVVANGAVVAVGVNGTVTVTNRSGGALDLVVDLVGVTLTGGPRADDWTSTQGSAGSSNANPGETSLTRATVASIRPVWESEAYAGVTDPPAIVDGTAFLRRTVLTTPGESDEVLTAVDVVTGRQRWSVSLPDGYQNNNGIAADHNAVYVGLNFGRPGAGLAAYSTATGARLWLTGLPPAPAPGSDDQQTYRVLVSRGLVTWTTEETTRVVDAATGTVLRNLAGVPSYAVAVDGDLLFYIANSDNALHAVDQRSGTELWHSPPKHYGGEVSIGGGRVVVTGGGISAYPELGCGGPTCQPLWNTSTEGAEYTSLGGVDPTTVLLAEQPLGRRSQWINFFDAGTGERRARFDVGGFHYYSQRPVLAGGVAWVGNGTGYLALPEDCDATSCRQLGGVPTQSTGYPTSTIAIAGGTLLVQGWVPGTTTAYRVP